MGSGGRIAASWGVIDHSITEDEGWDPRHVGRAGELRAAPERGVGDRAPGRSGEVLPHTVPHEPLPLPHEPLPLPLLPSHYLS